MLAIILLQEAIALGVLLTAAACGMLFVVVPLITIFFFVRLNERHRKKTGTNLSAVDYLIHFLAGLLFAAALDWIIGFAVNTLLSGIVLD